MTENKGGSPARIRNHDNHNQRPVYNLQSFQWSKTRDWARKTSTRTRSLAREQIRRGIPRRRRPLQKFRASPFESLAVPQRYQGLIDSELLTSCLAIIQEPIPPSFLAIGVGFAPVLPMTTVRVARHKAETLFGA